MPQQKGENKERILILVLKMSTIYMLYMCDLLLVYLRSRNLYASPQKHSRMIESPNKACYNSCRLL